MDCGKQADSCDKRAARCLQCAEIVWCEREPAEAVTSLTRLRERVGELEDISYELSEVRMRERDLAEAVRQVHAIVAESQGHRHRPATHRQIEKILAPLIAEA